jgi:hypothetical protein
VDEDRERRLGRQRFGERLDRRLVGEIERARREGLRRMRSLVAERYVKVTS